MSLSSILKMETARFSSLKMERVSFSETLVSTYECRRQQSLESSFSPSYDPHMAQDFTVTHFESKSNSLHICIDQCILSIVKFKNSLELHHRSSAHFDSRMSIIQPFITSKCLMAKKNIVVRWDSLQILFSRCLNTLISSLN